MVHVPEYDALGVSSEHAKHTLLVAFVHVVNSYVPITHGAVHVSTCVPPRQYELAGHAPHSLSEMFVHGTVSTTPWAQVSVQAIIDVPPLQ